MTKEMVLERKSNLVMPSHYVELDREEMSYVEGGFYLDNTTVNQIMYYSCIVAGIATTVLKMGWSVVKPYIASALAGITSAIFAGSASTIIGVVLGAAVALVVAIYGISFYEGIYVAQQKGTGVSMSISWFKLKKTYY